MSQKSQKRLWINWESHRRSSTLAEYFVCTYVELIKSGPFRYPLSILATIRLLFAERPDVLIVQNPSQILAAVAVVWKFYAPCYLVVDRHSTFLIGRDHERGIRLAVLRALSRFTLRFADLTIVTNEYLAQLVERAGGRSAILPDKLPSWPISEVPTGRDGMRSVVVVSSFADDEPIGQVMSACEGLSASDFRVFVTGRIEKAPSYIVEAPPPCVVFTGYLSEDDYVRLVAEADLVLVLTTSDFTMLCGCYEAIAAERALVSSDKRVLVEYFKGARFVDNSAQMIRDAITMSDDELAALKEACVRLKPVLDSSWTAQAQAVQQSFSSRGHDV